MSATPRGERLAAFAAWGQGPHAQRCAPPFPLPNPRPGPAWSSGAAAPILVREHPEGRGGRRAVYRLEEISPRLWISRDKPPLLLIAFSKRHSALPPGPRRWPVLSQGVESEELALEQVITAGGDLSYSGFD